MSAPPSPAEPITRSTFEAPSRHVLPRAVVLALLLSTGCVHAPGAVPAGRLDAGAFAAVMERLAAAWSTQDTALALSCFTPDAVYMQPPDQQLYRGHGELARLFGGLTPSTRMRFHRLAFDGDAQVGFGEFTFGGTGKPRADHGVVVVTMRDGRILSWREYFVAGPARFEDFTAVEGKQWRWTVDQLPAPPLPP